MIVDVSSNKERINRNLIAIKRSIQDLRREIYNENERSIILNHIGHIKNIYKDLILLSDVVYQEEYKVEENLELIHEFTKVINSKLTYKNILARYYGRETTIFLAEQW